VTLPEPLPEPVTVTQGAFDELVQLQPAVVVTVSVPVAPVGRAVTGIGETAMEQVVLFSVTVYGWPAIVSVPLLDVVPGFDAAV
jgi:hypothetical protein